jgi:hypothetical protein
MTDKKMLTERAYAAVEAHKAVYYREGDYVKADFWDYAEIFEINKRMTAWLIEKMEELKDI